MELKANRGGVLTDSSERVTIHVAETSLRGSRGGAEELSTVVERYMSHSENFAGVYIDFWDNFVRY